ncbi:hypothetical protein BDW68DRAFT_167822 [Aspergillus falconensis]
MSRKVALSVENKLTFFQFVIFQPPKILPELGHRLVELWEVETGQDWAETTFVLGSAGSSLRSVWGYCAST